MERFDWFECEVADFCAAADQGDSEFGGLQRVTELESLSWKWDGVFWLAGWIYRCDDLGWLKGGGHAESGAPAFGFVLNTEATNSEHFKHGPVYATKVSEGGDSLVTH